MEIRENLSSFLKTRNAFRIFIRNHTTTNDEQDIRFQHGNNVPRTIVVYEVRTQQQELTTVVD